jgi:hypothetical protein
MAEILTLFVFGRSRGSNLGPKTGYRDEGYSQPTQANFGIVLYIRPRPLPSTFFLIHYALIILSFDVI